MQDIHLNTDKVNVTLKISLLDFFRDVMDESMKNINCQYFSHHLMENDHKKDWTASAFSSNPDWQMEYWPKEYYNYDPLEQTAHRIAKINGCVITLWKIADPDSDVMERRKSACKLSTGVSFARQHDNGILENFSFGWEKYNAAQITHEKLLKLSRVADKFILTHHKLYREKN